MAIAPRHIISLPFFSVLSVETLYGGSVQPPQIDDASARQRLAVLKALEQPATIAGLPLIDGPHTRTLLRKCLVPEDQVAVVLPSFELASQGFTDTFRIGENQPARWGAIVHLVGRCPGASAPDDPIKPVVSFGSMRLQLIKRQKPYSQPLQFRDRLRCLIINLDIHHLRIVFLHATQRNMRPSFRDRIPVTTESLERDGQIAIAPSRHLSSADHQAQQDMHAGMHPRTPDASGIADRPNRQEAALW